MSLSVRHTLPGSIAGMIARPRSKELYFRHEFARLGDVIRSRRSQDGDVCAFVTTYIWLIAGPR